MKKLSKFMKTIHKNKLRIFPNNYNQFNKIKVCIQIKFYSMYIYDLRFLVKINNLHKLILCFFKSIRRIKKFCKQVFLMLRINKVREKMIWYIKSNWSKNKNTLKKMSKRIKLYNGYKIGKGFLIINSDY
jgi:hypothetical protein